MLMKIRDNNTRPVTACVQLAVTATIARGDPSCAWHRYPSVAAAAHLV